MLFRSPARALWTRRGAAPTLPVFPADACLDEFLARLRDQRASCEAADIDVDEYDVVSGAYCQVGLLLGFGAEPAKKDVSARATRHWGDSVLVAHDGPKPVRRDVEHASRRVVDCGEHQIRREQQTVLRPQLLVSVILLRFLSRLFYLHHILHRRRAAS